MPIKRDSVTEVQELPSTIDGPSCTRTDGYAALLGNQWFWFHALEPAYAFARAARMSPTVGQFHVVRAASEAKFDEGLGRDVFNLYVLIGGEVASNAEHDRDLIERFAAGLSHKSAHWPASSAKD
jgi:hypothetical protein